LIVWIASGKLLPPQYSDNDGEMDTTAESPLFKSVSTIGAGSAGSNGPLLGFLLSYDPSQLIPMGDGGNDNALDTLEISLFSGGIGSSLINLPLNNAADWTAIDPDNDGVIFVEETLVENTEYRLRVRAHDGDERIGTFDGGISVDDIAVTNGLVMLPIEPGDFDADGNLDGFDFLLWQQGQSPNPLSNSDLVDWQSRFGTELAALAGQSVPEPGNLLLFASFLLAIALFHRMNEKSSPRY
jgi:hypothetical protein